MRTERQPTIVLGAGMSGMGAAAVLGATAFESRKQAGGLCHSYYVDERGQVIAPAAADVSECFRFEPAGGHWLFGASEATLQRLPECVTFRRYDRRAAVYFARDDRLVPFPIQDHLRHLPRTVRNRALHEILAPPAPPLAPSASFRDWLIAQFGPTLCELFFLPFNERYTAGLCSQIAPQDAYKSPIDRERIVRGASGDTTGAGYNASFHYPEQGLDRLAQGLASRCAIRYDHEVVRIDTDGRVVHFANGARIAYQDVVSTLPLDRMMALCGVECPAPADPATAVLVVNAAVVAGPNCPSFHWVYVPDATSGLHRVGFYSNVERDFVPARHRADERVVSLYVERSYRSDVVPSAAERDDAVAAIFAELVAWGFVEQVIVAHHGFTDPAYTWSWAGSPWIRQARHTLREHGIRQVGRYGAWRFQGMLASFDEGRAAGIELSRERGARHRRRATSMPGRTSQPTTKEKA